MPGFIEVKCPCGRSLRARPDQAGTAIPCWECKAEVPVPYPDHHGLEIPLAAVASEALRSPSIPAIAVGAALITAALLVPHAGLVLALGLAVASVRYYREQVRAAADETSPGAATPVRTPRTLLARAILGIL